ncbi:MAG TPA: DUF4240 domain-containing protein [Puia sp.]
MGFFDKFRGGGKKDSSFTPSSSLLPEENFWQIIQTAFKEADGDFERQQETLAKQLRKLPLQELITFENRFRQLHGQAYYWPLWGAAYIIHGGCSDDSFIDFRDWVIAQGKEFYYKTLADPDSLVDMDPEKIDIEWEGMGYVAATVFEERTGEDIPSEFSENPAITGTEWEEEGDDLQQMFPRLWKKYDGDL